MTQDEIDARRYRWLRERWGRISETYAGDALVKMGDDPEGWFTEPDSLDAAIDAAMADEPRYTITAKGREMLREAE